MPTLNSESTIIAALESLRMQSLQNDLFEIIVVDGGSTDATIEIATRYGCRILQNKKVLPEFAKLIGLTAAFGRYAMLLDSDEALCKSTALEEKLHVLQSFPDVANVVTAGSIVPNSYDGISDYANRFGDPFSYFIYRIDGSDYWNSLRHRYDCRLHGDILIASFRNSDIIPICDAGAHFFDLEFLKSVADLTDIGTIPIIFPLMALHTTRLATIAGDFTIHYSKQTWSSYKKKLRWRVIANVHRSSGAEGFSLREKLHPRWIYFKKFFFIAYAVSLFLPIYDAVQMAVKYRKIGFLIHFPATIYTLAAMIKQMTRKIFSIPEDLPHYGRR